MANNNIQYLQGIDTVAYVRLLENAAKERGQLIRDCKIFCVN